MLFRSDVFGRPDIKWAPVAVIALSPLVPTARGRHHHSPVTTPSLRQLPVAGCVGQTPASDCVGQTSASSSCFPISGCSLENMPEQLGHPYMLLTYGLDMGDLRTDWTYPDKVGIVIGWPFFFSFLSRTMTGLSNGIFEGSDCRCS